MLVTLVLSALVVCNINAQFEASNLKDDKDSPQQPINLSFGDMMMTPDQIMAMKRGDDMGGSHGFSTVNGNNLRWTDAVIPYEIDCSIEYLEDATTAIFAAMKEWESKTCIRFVKRTNETYFLKFFRDTHCWGNVGMTSYTRISVGYGCEYHHVMTHEIGHVVGFYHEQNRKDRDQYVNVHWENIGQFKSAFDIVKNTDSLGVEYDYESIMHYPWSAFTSNGKDTMSPKKPLNGKVPYIGLSADDAKQTSLMYNCPAVERRRAAGRAKRHIDEARQASDTTNECEDTGAYCSDWAGAGYCSSDTYTKKHCKLTCNSNCPNYCKDKDADCPGWARMGYCANDGYTKKNCHLSCNDNCPNNCIDKDAKCPEWKAIGHCTLNPTVAKICKKSCNPACADAKTTKAPQPSTKTTTTTTNTISKGTTKAPQTIPPTKKPDRKFLGKGILCKDQDSRCAKWANQDGCTRNPGYMLKNCQISCNQTSCDATVQKPPGSCANPLGLSDDGSGTFKIPDSAFYSPGHLAPGGGWAASAMNARLYFRDDYTNKRIGAWCAASHNQAKSDTEGYVQVDLGSQRTITYIATQGRDKYFERVGQYKIQYSNDGSNFQTYQEGAKDKLFEGNCDHVHPVLNKFNNQITARYIRYLPWQWNYPCVRMELYGC